MRKVLLFTCGIAISSLAWSQTFTVSGIVTDAHYGKVLVGATVSEGPVGTVTDTDGRYRIELSPGSHSLRFSFIGYEEQVKEVNGIEGGAVTVNMVMSMKAGLLNQVVVSSGKFDQKLSEVTVSMEVVKPELISRSSNVNLEQTLDRIPGVGMVDGQANIRGGAGYSYGAGTRVLILVDGLPFLSGDAGFPSWGFLPVENMAQVEVIKGASSALYGSAAMNGVINLRTAYPTSEPVTKFQFLTGVYQNPRDNVTSTVDHIDYNIVNGDTIGADTAFVKKSWWGQVQPVVGTVSVSHRQQIGQVDLVVGGFALSQDHYRQGEYDRKARGNINWRYRFKKAEGLSIGMNTSIEHSRSATFFLWNGLEEKMYQPFPNTITNNDAQRFTFDPFITYFDKHNNRHKLMGRWYRNFNTTDQNQSTLSDLYYGEYQYQHHFDSIGLVLTSGVAVKYANVEAELYIKDFFSTTNAGVYLQADKKIGTRINLSGGARYEFNELDSLQEGRPVFRLGANMRVAKATFVRSSYGQGYRFPTIAEKFVRTDVGLLSIYPNENLVSETGWTAEVGVKQGLQLSRWQGFADIAFFWQEYRDMMEFTFGGESGTLFGFQSVNVGNTKIRGVEVTLAGTGTLGPVPLDLSAGYTYVDPLFAEFDSAADLHSSAGYNVLKYRFRHTLKGDLETHWRILSVGMTARYYSFMEAMDAVFVLFVPGIEQFREENNDGDWVLDGRIGVKLGDDAMVWFIVSNLLNNEYTLRPALIEPPRNYALRFISDVKWRPENSR